MDLRSAAVYVIPKSLGLSEPSILETPGTKPKYPKPNTTTMATIMSPIKKLLMNPIQHLPHQRKLAQAARQKKYDALIVLNMGQKGRQILFSITECFTLREM